MTTRPKTLFAALSPVLIGAALAMGHDRLNTPVWLATLLVAVLVQIGTNFCNDVFDHLQGADTEERQGPRRGLHSGRISLRAMIVATIICFLGVAVVSALLIQRGGVPVVWLAVLSIFCGIFYTAGPWSLAYTGLADIFVLVFFGPVAVGGTYYLQFPEAGWPPLHVLVAGLGPGFIATALLTVNNLRDVDEDRQHRKNTLAVRFGRTFSRWEYKVCMLLALFLPFGAAALAGRGWWAGCTLVLLPKVQGLIQKVNVGESGVELNPVLGATGKILLFYALLFSLTWPLGG